MIISMDVIFDEIVFPFLFIQVVDPNGGDHVQKNRLEKVVERI